MFIKTKISRFFSTAAAAVCLISGVKLAPMQFTTDAADELTAFEITEAMQLGWNLGNTLDSYDGNLPSMGLEAETKWGNPVTTKEMIDTVKAKGFNTVRVPVTWFQHVDKNNGYKIDDAWLARVKEVVDYCYDNGMYVILNLHHEEPYQNRSTLGADYEEITGYVSALWKQIAEAFKDYDQHLVFETMNEPRATGTDHEWWGPTKDEVDTINKINADAVNVIRGVDSPYSDSRLIMIPGYCASSDTTMMAGVVVPDDDYVAVSVHAYSPYGFAMDDKIADHSTFTTAYSNELTTILDGIRKTFGDKDIPVVLGEFSASNFGNTDARVEWAEAYIKTTKEMGMPCVLWDNNVIANNGGEAHGYLDRKNCTWYEASEPVVDKMVEVMNDKSVVWGSARKSPVIEHDDITTGKQIIDKTYNIDASVENGNCTPGLDVSWADLKDGDVAIKFTGDIPVIAVCDADWDDWTEIKHYDVDEEKGIAYYSSQHIAAAWEGKNRDVKDIAHLFARTNGKTSITAIAIIGEGKGDITDPPEDDTKVYEISMADRKGSDKLTFVIEGDAGSTTNGCVGYMGDDWTSLEWEGKIASDGKLTVEVDISSIPASISSAQIQIWWCDDKTAEMTSYSFGNEIQPPTQEPTSNPSEKIAYGDVNCDGEVTVADATLLLQYLGNRDKYTITDAGKLNADVDGESGLSAVDALVIQQLDAGVYTMEQIPLSK
ncbi:MAG: cellulase family glycosylhydrolase [Ruminococcus sp.]|nr:cellulase family glycosylhydrolase [Ruminococcus sp.]